MFFIASHTSADLSLTTPPEFCCNCGSRSEVVYVETPLKRVRYFFVFGTELTLTEHFPYCKKCTKTAARVRQGWGSKALIVCMFSAAWFLAFTLLADSLPKLVSANLFVSSVAVACLIVFAYFYFQEARRNQRTHYQPVSLVDAQMNNDQISQIRLKFYNAQYAALMRKANADQIRSGLLKVEADGS